MLPQRQWHLVHVAARLLHRDEDAVYDLIDSGQINWRRVGEKIEVQLLYDRTKSPTHEPLPPVTKK